MSGRYGSSGYNWREEFMRWLKKRYPYLYAYYYNDEEEEEEVVLSDEEVEEEVVPTEKELHVKSVDLDILNNTKNHYTNKYKCTQKSDKPQLVIRRGQEFNMNITFNRPYNPKDDDLEIDFKNGSSPKENRSEPGKGSLIEMKLDESGALSSDANKWHARLVKKSGNSLEVAITPSANCLIGQWEYNIYSQGRRENTRSLRYEAPVDIIILFNPWCKQDPVYFENDSLDANATCDPRHEYILNNTGVLFKGSNNHMKGKAWRFGQFDIDILRICWKVLLAHTRGVARTDFSCPIKTSRMISQLVNSNDDNGVLEGKWGGNYSDGTSPTAWTGTPAILRQLDKNEAPVKYGQCWVFSGVVTTFCRALGIPARSITNYNSAHDTDNSATIDLVLGSNESSDSIWNFHVWNEVWLSRPDIPNHDGWQIVDATPQERSGGVFRCGPCPLKAVKLGQVNLLYDTAFVFAEVNADRITWAKQPNGKWKNVKTEPDIVGKRISTKPCTGKPYVGVSGRTVRHYEKDKRYDTTHLYKFSPGSDEERLAVSNATQLSRRNPRLSEIKEHQELVLTLKTPEATVGEKFKVELEVKCDAVDATKNITVDKLDIVLSSEMYSGNNRRKIKTHRERFGFRMKKGDVKSFTMEVGPDDYVHKLSEQLDFRVLAIARIKQTKEDYVEYGQFELDNAELVIEAPKSCRQGDDKVKVKMSFTNPLPKALRNCKILIDTENFDDVERMFVKEISPKETWTTSFFMRANAAGHGEVSAVLDSDELPDVEGSANIMVT